VFVSAMNMKDPARVAEALNKASGFVQKELGRQIDMKFTPKLRFEADDRFDEALHVDEVLDRPKVKRDLDDGADPADGETR